LDLTPQPMAPCSSSVAGARSASCLGNRCSRVSPRIGLPPALLLGVFLAACGGNDTAPSTPKLSLTCPPSQSVLSPNGAAVVVNYPAPVAAGGKAPITLRCEPPSGTTFAVASTAVTCTARDAAQSTASCGFPVAVTRTPRLNLTRFVAFGDSITAGTVATDCGASTGNSCAITTSMSAAQRRALMRHLFENLEVSTAAYPRALQTLLAARYASQPITVANEGLPGEQVSDGKVRLPGALTGTPQVLLLLEGANDINQGRAVDAIAEDLRSMIRTGKGRGMTVFLATLLPQRQRGCRAYDFCDGVEDTALLDARLRVTAQNEGATLVDLYPAFAGHTDTLLGLDGLHPNELGYQKMAEVFFNAISQQLEAGSVSRQVAADGDEGGGTESVDD
jgi:lysophospholipase L1-like esterase